MARLLLLALLTGCAHYQWKPDGMDTDWYRWVKVPHAEFPARCGFQARAGFMQGGACAVRLQAGVVMPGDTNLHTGERAKTADAGRVCIIFGTMDEDEAKRMTDADGMDLWAHELRHCAGHNHQ